VEERQRQVLRLVTATVQAVFRSNYRAVSASQKGPKRQSIALQNGLRVGMDDFSPYLPYKNDNLALSIERPEPSDMEFARPEDCAPCRFSTRKNVGDCIKSKQRRRVQVMIRNRTRQDCGV